MSLLDKFIAAVTPFESEQDRRDARREASATAGRCEWLRLVLAHHRAVEEAFAQLAAAPDARARRRAQRWLVTLLTGHSMAEEAVLYPALALAGQKLPSTTAYAAQSEVKVGLAALADMDPMGRGYLDKLEHLRVAVAHHVYQEESEWFVELARAGDAGLHRRLGARYAEEFSRYMGPDESQD